MTRDDKAQNDAEGDEKPPLSRWKLLAFSLLGGAWIILGYSLGHGELAQWTLFFGIGVVGAAALFWSKRKRPWYWPSVALLTCGHAFLLLYLNWDGLEVRGAVAGKGAAFGDLALNCLWLFWMSWLFDPKKPRTPGGRALEFALYTIAVLVISLVAFLSWALPRRNAERQATLQTVFEATVSNRTYDLKTCITPNQTRGWLEVLDNPKTWRRNISDVQTTIIDYGEVRVIQVKTPRGKPLSQGDSERFVRCLTPRSMLTCMGKGRSCSL